jgi:hypothetical protein
MANHYSHSIPPTPQPDMPPITPIMSNDSISPDEMLRKFPTASTSEFKNRLLRPMLKHCESQSSQTKPEQKMHDIQIAASIYAIIFGLITLGAWTTANGFSNQANCLAKAANVLNVMQLCTTTFVVRLIVNFHDHCMPYLVFAHILALRACTIIDMFKRPPFADTVYSLKHAMTSVRLYRRLLFLSSKKSLKISSFPWMQSTLLVQSKSRLWLPQ